MLQLGRSGDHLYALQTRVPSKSLFGTGDLEMGIDREVLSIFRAWSQIPMLGAGYIGFGPFRHYSKGPYRRDDE